MIDCQAFDVLQRTCLEGTPSPEQQATMEAHLAACPACVARMRNSLTLTEVLRRFGESGADEPAPMPLSERLVTRILAAHRAEAAQPAARRRISG